MIHRSLAPVAGLLASTLLVAACGPVTLPLPASQPAQPLAINVPAASVQRSDIQQAVSYSGDIRAREQITVMPKATGRVQRVLVDVGDPIHAGDLLAELEADSPQIAVLQARANLEATQAKLSTIQAGAKAEDVQQAQEALDQQRAKLAGMRAQGRREDVAAAQAALAAQQAKLTLLEQGGRPEAVAATTAQVDAAAQKLALLQKGATDDVRQAAVSAVNADQAQVAAAEAAYSALGGTNAADLQAAQSSVASLAAAVNASQSVVSAADAALASLRGTSAADVQAAQSALATAQAQRQAAQAALDQAYHPTGATVAQARAAVAAAQAQRQQAEEHQTSLEQSVAAPCAPTISPINGQTVQEPNGTACNEAKAAASAGVAAGDAAVFSAQAQLALLQAGGPPATQAALQSQLTAADQQVKVAQARLAALQGGQVDAQRAQIQAQKDQAQAQLSANQENLKVAQARLSALTSGAQDAQIKAAASQVQAAREKLAADQAHLEQLVAGPQDEEVQAAQDAVDQAQAALDQAAYPATAQDIAAQRALVDQARQQVLKAQQPYTQFDIAQQEHAVAQAEAALRARQQPYTDQDLAAAQAAVDQAQAALEQAQLGVRETQITAPVDGVVFERQAAPGALVGPTSPIVTIVPPRLEVAVNVDEAQLGQIQRGQSVQLTVPAYPDQVFGGTVTAIAPAVDPKTRTASVRVEPSDDQAAKLKPGMLATVQIVTAHRANTLVVPREALQGSPAPNSPSSLVALDGNRAQRRAVSIGLLNDRFAEVTAGLAEGQLVAVGNGLGLNNGDAVVPQLRTAAVGAGV